MKVDFEKMKECWYCSHAEVHGHDCDVTIFCACEDENVKKKYGWARNAENCPRYDAIKS